MRLAETAGGFSGRIGYALADLTSDQLILADADDMFPTASAVKLPVLTAFHTYVAQGRASWDDTVGLSPHDVPGGSGVLQYLSLPRPISFRDAAWLMICLSDNLATNVLLRTMSIEWTNECIRSVIGPGIIVDSYAYFQPDRPTRSMGRATPRALLDYIKGLAAGRFPGSAGTLDIARKQFYRNMIPRYLPYGAYGRSPLQIANKTGSLPGVRTDIALIENRTKSIALAIMTADSRDAGFSFENEGEVYIGKLARLTYDAWCAEDVVPR